MSRGCVSATPREDRHVDDPSNVRLPWVSFLLTPPSVHQTPPSLCSLLPTPPGSECCYLSSAPRRPRHVIGDEWVQDSVELRVRGGRAVGIVTLDTFCGKKREAAAQPPSTGQAPSPALACLGLPPLLLGERVSFSTECDGRDAAGF